MSGRSGKSGKTVYGWKEGEMKTGEVTGTSKVVHEVNSGTYFECLNELIGSTAWTGNMENDEEALKNLYCLMDVVGMCVDMISNRVGLMDRPEESAKRMGEAAFAWLMELGGQVKKIEEERWG